MAFIKKTWKDRQSEYPNRRILVSTGNDREYDVSRSEGLVIEEGDKLDAAALNDFEARVEAAVNETAAACINVYTQASSVLTGSGTNGKFKATASGTYTAFTIGGVSYAVKAGSETEIELTSGVWYSFILDTEAKNINFKAGGAGLNFKIVGGTSQPSSPKENTIWIETDTAIGEYQFSATEPTTRADGTALQNGDVWICTNVYAGTSFNALKKNGLQVNMSYCRQYNGSSWVVKNFKIYTNNKWADIDLVIFDGKAVLSGYSFVTASGDNVTTVIATPVINTNEGYLYGNTQTLCNVLRLTEPIDLTTKTTIEAEVSFTKVTGSTGFRYLYVADNINGPNHTIRDVQVSCANKGTTRQTVTLDITNVSGLYYICLAAYYEGNTIGSYLHSLKVY